MKFYKKLGNKKLSYQKNLEKVEKGIQGRQPSKIVSFIVVSRPSIFNPTFEIFNSIPQYPAFVVLQHLAKAYVWFGFAFGGWNFNKKKKLVFGRTWWKKVVLFADIITIPIIIPYAP